MLEQEINQEIKAAMLSKNEARLRGLRAIKAALLLAKTEKGASEEITEDTEIKVLQKLAKQRRESAEIYKTQSRDDLYTIEIEELDVIEGFLPKQLSADEVQVQIKAIIESSGANSIKDMGKVMALLKPRLAGKADMGKVSNLVKTRLSG